MNKRQTITLWAGIVILVVMGAFPPWRIETGKKRILRRGTYAPSKIVSGQYTFLFTSPEKAVGLDITRLLAQGAIIAMVTGGLLVSFKRNVSHESKRPEVAMRAKAPSLSDGQPTQSQRPERRIIPDEHEKWRVAETDSTSCEREKSSVGQSVRTGQRASVKPSTCDVAHVGPTIFEPKDRIKNGQPGIEASDSVAPEMSSRKRYESPTRYQPPKVRQRKRTIWPTVLGSLSILLAGILAIGAVLSAAFMPRLNIGFATEQAGAPVSNSGADFVETGFSAFAFCLCLLLAASGIFTLIRRRIARPLSMLAGAVLGASAIMSLVAGLLIHQSFPSDMNAWSQVGYAMGRGFGTVFPIVLLLWFLREDVQAEVSSWS